MQISQFSATRSGGTGSQKVAGGVSGHFCLVKTPSIAIWGNIFLFRGGWGALLTDTDGRADTCNGTRVVEGLGGSRESADGMTDGGALAISPVGGAGALAPHPTPPHPTPPPQQKLFCPYGN